MDCRAIFFVLLLALVEIKTKQLDPGPQAVKESESSKSHSSPGSTPKSQKRYATEEVILYLTPSQIQALQAGKGLVTSQFIPKAEEKQQQNNQRLTFQDHEEFVKQQFENIKSARIAPVEEPQYENLELASHGPSFGKEELSYENLQKNVEFFKLWEKSQARAEEQAKSENSQLSGNEQIDQWNVEKEKYLDAERKALQNYGSISEKNQKDRLLNDQLNQQWKDILQQNRVQLKALTTLASEKENTESISTQTEKPLLQLQYAPKYNDQKNAIEIARLVRERHRQELEQQSTLTTAEAIANAAPILVHQEVKITKHHPVPVVKHVKVSIPTPVLVPVPEPYAVKVPHPYPVPLEIIKPIPVPILKTERIEVDKPVPYEVEKRIPVPVTKNVYVNVDRPYYVQKLVPVEVKKKVPVEIPIRKAEKITILRHVWND